MRLAKHQRAICAAINALGVVLADVFVAAHVFTVTEGRVLGVLATIGLVAGGVEVALDQVLDRSQNGGRRGKSS